MCFGSSDPGPAVTPAPAPAPPQPTADQQPVGGTRKAEDIANYGSITPNLRVDRSVASGGTSAGGAGLKL